MCSHLSVLAECMHQAHPPRLLGRCRIGLKTSGLAIRAIRAAKPLAASLMEEAKLVADVCQAHLSGDDLMAEHATILLELNRFFPFFRSPFRIGQLIYDVHIRQ